MKSTSASRRILVVSDGSRLPRGSELSAVLAGQAHRLEDLGFDTSTAQLRAGDLVASAHTLGAVRGDVSAFYLVHTEADQAWRVRQALEHTGHVVVTDDDLRAVVAAAHLLTELHRRKWAIDRSAVVVADSDELPAIGALLTAIGIRNMVFWRQADAPAVPLEQVTQDAAVLLDLRAAPAPHPRAEGHDGPLVIRLPALADALPVLPGLLIALSERAGRPQTVLAATAHLLATTAVPGMPLAAPGTALTDEIAWAARQTLSHPPGL
ncbi:hypothetical protein [Paractinoplanes lichenicola]|uniref:Uncharacterized protein n=1 Tax=Paractinoplanes lichenicola TaxID=2802976 RepID=A0ABS1VE20_9ACTN|nr:hypothetical protein [Actinoplanes lichenicola]MBL7252937.1 hypothetical protein [Actinoplanes lichenicola]